MAPIKATLESQSKIKWTPNVIAKLYTAAVSCLNNIALRMCAEP